MKHPPLVLASESPRRVLLLRAIVPEFAVTPSHATELHDIIPGIGMLLTGVDFEGTL